MGPREFYRIVAEPNIDEFREKYGSLQRAHNAVAAIDALAAHIYAWCVQNAPAEVAGVNDDTDYRARLAQNNAEFQLLRDIAKANKHVRLTRGQPQVSQSSQVSQKSLGWDQAPWDEGRWDSVEQVVVDTNNGDIRVLETIVVEARDFLLEQMDRLNI